MKPRPSPVLIDVLTPDPMPLAALLRDAVAARRATTGQSEADVARAAGLTPPQLSRALRDGAEPREQTTRPLLRALGLRVALVPAER